MKFNMPIPRNEIHGAKWWKFDFHNHTPASFDYGKGHNQQNLKNVTARQWLLDYMANEIDCVAITDHNSGEWIDILKAEYSIMERENPTGFRPIFIFPGVELSVSGGFHVLAIFDPSRGTADIDSLLGRVGFLEGSKGESEAVTEKACSAVIEEVTRMEGVAIPAHVNLDGSGLFKKQQGITLKQTLSTDGLLAIEITDTTLPKPPMYDELKLSLAQVIGSDSHHPVGEPECRIGKWFTWVKMEKPSLEALRLALHDGIDGVVRFDEEPKNPNEVHQRFFLKKLIVKNGFKTGLGGVPLEVNFSPWFSTLIGGRGTGKSTVLNFLRIVLDQGKDMPAPMLSDFRSFCDVGKRGGGGMLRDNTEIEVFIMKDGREIKLKWENGTNERKESIHGINGDWEEYRVISNVNEQYPLNIFSQKELYELTKDPKTLIRNIDREFDKISIDARREELEKTWMQKRNEIRQLESGINEESNFISELQGIEARIKTIEEAWNDPVLRQYESVQKASDLFNKTRKFRSKFGDTLDHLERQFETLSYQEDLKDLIDEASWNTVNSLNEGLSGLKDSIDSLKQLFVEFDTNVSERLASLPWNHISADISSKYNEQIGNLTQKGQGLGKGEHERLLQRREFLNSKLVTINTQRTRLQCLLDEARAQYEEIISLEKETRVRRKEVIDRINSRIGNAGFGDGQNDLSLLLKYDEMGDANSAEQAIRNLIRKSGDTFSNEILTTSEGEPSGGIIHRLINADVGDMRWQERERIVSELSSLTEETPGKYGKRFARHIESLSNNTPEDIDRILLWVPEDKIKLFLRRGRNTQQIETGSAGQRTAAMLSLLMALNDSPLIIDQPEDDLDTRLITDLVVEGVKRLKRSRQLIVVTHNPNVTVNGCAENIVEMRFIGGQISANVYGALQNKECRLAICDVMEGGKKALDNRYFRISKAIS